MGPTMNRSLTSLLLSAAFLVSANAMAAPPKFAIMNNAPVALIDDAVARTIWLENLPVKTAEKYPVKKLGYLSEVNGGFDDHKNCVVVARAMQVPVSGKNFTYDPKKTSITLATQAGATPEQCSALAKLKLKEAVQSLVAGL
jgi:hypothetical protein